MNILPDIGVRTANESSPTSFQTPALTSAHHMLSLGLLTAQHSPPAVRGEAPSHCCTPRSSAPPAGTSRYSPPVGLPSDCGLNGCHTGPRALARASPLGSHFSASHSSFPTTPRRRCNRAGPSPMSQQNPNLSAETHRKQFLST